MVTKRDLVIAVLATFCLTATLFMILPTESSPAVEYDPWVDLDDDGKIGIKDLYKIATSFGTTGKPINKTALLLELQNKLETLEATIKTLEINGTILPDVYEIVQD